MNAESTVGELVAARPLLARVFEKLGIDYCCGGKQTLAAVCARRGLDLPTTLTVLESAGAALVAGFAEVDAASMGQQELADHIEAVHHSYLKTELPRLVEMAERVAIKHGWRDGRLAEVRAAVRDLAEEMLSHMQKEELILFPMVRQIAAGGAIDLAGPIAQMEAEHEAAGNLTARLRLLTDGFTPGADACNTHRALLAGLAEFEADLHRHVHKENNILFPRAHSTPPTTMAKKIQIPNPKPGSPRTSAKSPMKIARALAEHQNDPQHHFHARGQMPDGRVIVAAGERLQRVRSRAHAG